MLASPFLPRAYADHQRPAPGLAQAVPRAGCVGVVDVHVVETFDHAPVSDAFVMVENIGRGATNARGQLTVGGLCPGTVTVEIIHPAFEEARRRVAVVNTAAVEIELAPLVQTVTVTEKAAPPADMRATTVLTGEALERKRGRSLSETLSDVPGVSQLRSGTGMAKPIVRGHAGRRLPILVDGVRHRAQEWGIDHAPEIDPAIADRITVVRGASGVRYGSDAIGGVVLVDPPPLLDTPGVVGEAHLIGYANGLGGGAMGRLQVAPSTTPGLAVQLEGSGKRSRAPSTPDYPLDNTGESEWSAGLAATYRRGVGVYQLSFRHFQTELGVCMCLRVDSADDFFAQLGRGRPLGSELYTSSFEIERPYQAVSHELAVARARWLLPAVGSLTGTYALQFDNRRELDVVRQATTGPQFSFRQWTHDADVAFEHVPVHVTDHVHLSGAAGVVGMLQHHDYSGLPLVPSHQAVAGGVYVIERLWGHSYEVEAGVRYDALARRASIVRRDFLRLVRSGQLAAATCGAAEAEADPVTCASRFHTISASLGGLLRMSPEWTVKLDLSTASRPPNPDEQYLNGSAPSLPVVGLGQPDATAETTYSASATLAYAGPRVAGEISAFGSYISDYLNFAPAIDPAGGPIFDVLIRGAFPRFVTRAVDATFYGADGAISATPVRWLELGAQASVVRARNLTDGGYVTFVPPDRVRASVAVTPGRARERRGVTASVAGTYAARQSRFDLAADLAPPPDAYFLLEAALEVHGRLAGQTVKVALQGTNILGARYREYASLLRYFADQPGRQLMLRITMLYDSTRTP
jgi:iron complex outermembrane receptor protein